MFSLLECKRCDANGSHSQRVPKGWGAAALRLFVLRRVTRRRPAGISRGGVPWLSCKRSTSAVSLGHTQRSWAGTRLSSVVVIQKGLGFLSLELFQRSGQTRKLSLDRKRSNCAVLTNVQRQQTTKAWRKQGALCPLLCISLAGISGVGQKETRHLQTTPRHLHLIFR